MSRLTVVEPDAISLPEPTIYQALDDMVRKARAANPVTAMLVYETSDGLAHTLTYPDSPHLREGLINSLHRSIEFAEVG